jgi:ABC-type uncharacterized transport system substrate-binding protein
LLWSANQINRGQNLNITYRFAEGQADRYPALAAELVQMPVDVIITWGTRLSYFRIHQILIALLP